MIHDIDVAIVGAGAAGIGAARRLAGSGLNVLMIEAAQRIGGRAWTQVVEAQRLDLGCGWLHSADRNPLVELAQAMGAGVDRARSGWGSQYQDLGFSKSEREAAHAAFAAWSETLRRDPPASDRAADSLPPDGEWNAYLHTISGFMNGEALERISVADYVAYEDASTSLNWRLDEGMGTLIAAARPAQTPLMLATPVTTIDLEGDGVGLVTPAGMLRARRAILTVSTAVLAGRTIRLPPALDEWRHAAASLPLGRDEKLFLSITDESVLPPDSYLLGDPREPGSTGYSMRPLGRPVIECFLGGIGARRMAARGQAEAFGHAIDQLAGLLGNDIRRHLKPLVASAWAADTWIGGAYSHALPGCRAARATLARPFEDRLFFAGEATHPFDFSTAHGAYASGMRAAEEVLEAGGSAR